LPAGAGGGHRKVDQWIGLFLFPNSERDQAYFGEYLSILSMFLELQKKKWGDLLQD